MKVIDSHIHFWDLSNNINSWISHVNVPELSTNYMPDAIIEQFKEQLYGVVHIEAHDSSVPTITEVQWLNRVMQNIPDVKYRHIAFVDITLPQLDFSKIIDVLKTQENVVGIRHILSFNPKFSYSPCDRDLSTNTNINDNLIYLAKVGFIFDCQMYAYQLNNILPAIINSNVICVIDHLVLPAWHTLGDQDHQVWQHTINRMAQLNNVFIKLSGLDMFRTTVEFDGVVNFCLDNFPCPRIMYGSNYPVSFNDNYNDWFGYLNKLNLSPAVKEQIFFSNAFDVFFKSK